MDIEAKLKNQVSRAIREFQMFHRQQKILVGISGGKDSLSLAYLLKKLNFDITGLFIHLGIPEFSDLSLEKSREFLTWLQIPLLVVSPEEETGYSMIQAQKDYPGHLCAVCGTLKRRIFNSVSRKQGFDVFCTGHHLDDEAANLLADNLRWDWEYLKKCHPVLEPSHGFVKRAKPFCLTREEEIARFAREKSIPFVDRECAHSKKGSRHKYEALLVQMDHLFPGGVAGYYGQFLKTSGFLKAMPEQGVSLKPCQHCGETTSQNLCRVCLMTSGSWQR